MVNIKRVQSMSKKGREVKESGHAWEVVFNAYFHKRQGVLNLSGASNDCFITDIKSLEKLKPLNVEGFRVSLKSGNTWQFHLGAIPELSDKNYYLNSLRKVIQPGKKKEETCGTHHIPFEKQKEVLTDPNFWWSYFGKGDYLCYTNRVGQWRFFAMRDVINFIINNTSWRLIHTGRIKGDLLKEIKKKDGSTIIRKYSVITFEYNEKKNSFFLGACGGQGEGANGFRLMQILSDNIPFEDIVKQ